MILCHTLVAMKIRLITQELIDHRDNSLKRGETVFNNEE